MDEAPPEQSVLEVLLVDDVMGSSGPQSCSVDWSVLGPSARIDASFALSTRALPPAYNAQMR